MLRRSERKGENKRVADDRQCELLIFPRYSLRAIFDSGPFHVLVRHFVSLFLRCLHLFCCPRGTNIQRTGSRHSVNVLSWSGQILDHSDKLLVSGKTPRNLKHTTLARITLKRLLPDRDSANLGYGKQQNIPGFADICKLIPIQLNQQFIYFSKYSTSMIIHFSFSKKKPSTYIEKKVSVIINN